MSSRPRPIDGLFAEARHGLFSRAATISCYVIGYSFFIHYTSKGLRDLFYPDTPGESVFFLSPVSIAFLWFIAGGMAIASGHFIQLANVKRTALLRDRIYRLPLSSWKVVTGLMVPGLALGFLLGMIPGLMLSHAYSAYSIFTFPCTVLLFTGVFQGLWFGLAQRPTTLVLAVFVLIILLFSGYVYFELREATYGAWIVPLSLGAIPCCVAAAALGFERQRHAGRREPRGPIHQIPIRGRVRSKHFQSRDEALGWLGWREFGWIMPLIAVAMLGVVVGIELSWIWQMGSARRLIADEGLTTASLYWLLAFAAIAAGASASVVPNAGSEATIPHRLALPSSDAYLWRWHLIAMFKSAAFGYGLFVATLLLLTAVPALRPALIAVVQPNPDIPIWTAALLTTAFGLVVSWSLYSAVATQLFFVGIPTAIWIALSFIPMIFGAFEFAYGWNTAGLVVLFLSMLLAFGWVCLGGRRAGVLSWTEIGFAVGAIVFSSAIAATFIDMMYPAMPDKIEGVPIRHASVVLRTAAIALIAFCTGAPLISGPYLLHRARHRA